jgi:hypothetical protein
MPVAPSAELWPAILKHFNDGDFNEQSIDEYWCDCRAPNFEVSHRKPATHSKPRLKRFGNPDGERQRCLLVHRYDNEVRSIIDLRCI